LHLDEMVVMISGKKHSLWRTVDQDGFVLEMLIQSRCNTKAAKCLLRKLLKKQHRAASCHGDRQAEILRGGQEGDHAGHRASPAQRAQQPDGKLTPGHPLMGTTDEAVQVGPPRSALRLDP
jgi:putative transposase